MVLSLDEAQKSVNNTVARLVAWSLKCSAEGVAPDTGLYGEPLTGFRAEMKGKSLGPWKSLVTMNEFSYIFLFHYNVNPSYAVCI